MAGLKAVFLKKLSMTADAMGRYAITRRKTRAGAVVPKIHARRSVVALIAGDSTTPVGSLSQQERDKPPAHCSCASTRDQHPSLSDIGHAVRQSRRTLPGRLSKTPAKATTLYRFRTHSDWPAIVWYPVCPRLDGTTNKEGEPNMISAAFPYKKQRRRVLGREM